MNYNQLSKQIAAGDLKSLYFLTGEESYLLKKAEKLILQAVFPDGDTSSLTIFHSDPELKELMIAVETIPFFNDKNLIIIKECTWFKSSRKTENIEDETQNGGQAKNSSTERLITLFDNMPPYSHIIFISGEKPDKRRKIYKSLEQNGIILEAAPLKGRDLREWLFAKLAELKIKMSSDAREYLLFVVSMMPNASLDFLQNELEKIALYTLSHQSSAPLTLSKLKEILAKAPEISIFAMIEALRQKNLALSLELLKEQLKAGKHPVQILALLARQIDQLRQSKYLLSKGYDIKQLASHFKLPLFIAEKLARQSGYFSLNILERAVVEMAEADYFLKSGRSGVYVLEKIMIEMCHD